MSNKIIQYFENKSKDVINLDIIKKINKPCVHCGYGKIYIGTATIKPMKEDYSNDRESSSEDSEDNEDSEIVDFVYHTGCLSYDDEMTYKLERD